MVEGLSDEERRMKKDAKAVAKFRVPRADVSKCVFTVHVRNRRTLTFFKN